MPDELSHIQIAALNRALVETFDEEQLEMLVQNRLGIRLRSVVSSKHNLDYQVFKLTERGKADGWLTSLVAAALDSKPGSPSLTRLALNSTRVASDYDQSFERTIVAANPEMDPDRILAILGRLTRQVCQVVVRVDGRTSLGTGFLVGNDVVLTNEHVIRPALGISSSQAIQARFDYRLLSDGRALGEESREALADSWLIDHSIELDYALLRLARPVGAHTIRPERSSPTDDARGYVLVPHSQISWSASTPIYILQHPEGRPLKLTIDTQSVIAVTSNGKRVRYRTNTEPGASGSPCFNANWELVALHRSGDPTLPPLWNEGVPIDRIVAQAQANTGRKWRDL